jgi:type IV pilus assembly protein PilV
MISLVVLAIGVMGVIGLQTSTYKQLQTSKNLSKAAMLASDMADRMLANHEEAALGAYTHVGPADYEPNPNCATVACTPAQLAAYDVWAWQAELKGVTSSGTKVPGSLPSATGEVQQDGRDFIVLVRWDDDLDGDKGTVCSALDPNAGPDDLNCYALNLGCLDTQDPLDIACP